MNTGITGDTDRWQPADHIVFVVRDEQGVLLDLQEGRYYLLNDTATAIWTRMCGNRPVGEIKTELVTHYSGDPSAVQREVGEFIAALAAYNMVMRVA